MFGFTDTWRSRRHSRTERRYTHKSTRRRCRPTRWPRRARGSRLTRVTGARVATHTSDGRQGASHRRHQTMNDGSRVTQVSADGTRASLRRRSTGAATALVAAFAARSLLPRPRPAPPVHQLSPVTTRRRLHRPAATPETGHETGRHQVGPLIGRPLR